MSSPLPNRRITRLPAVFLDRDGVINRDSAAYIKSWKEFSFLPGSREAIARLVRHGCLVIVITNQSAVGRGMMTRETLEEMLRCMRREVEAVGGRIHDILYCPHLPGEGCDCRKPRPGMIHEAARRHGIDLASSVMIGDSEKDVECGLAAGCGTTVLVLTGNGLQARSALDRKGIVPDIVAADLAEAVAMLLRESSPPP